MKERFIQMLKEEVKPALGCTEPVAVALATAKAREILGEKVEKCIVHVSPNIYKNGMCVGIPGTERLGLTISGAMGLVGGKSELGLKVLESLTEAQVKESEEGMDNNLVEVYPLDTKQKVVVKVVVKSASSEAEIGIEEKHDNIVYIRKNDEVIKDERSAGQGTVQATSENIFDTIRVREMIDIVDTFTEEEIGFLYDGVDMNKAIASFGLQNPVGAKVGSALKESFAEDKMEDSLLGRAMIWTAAASDARMSGINMPVMSSNGSGNHGITAILPIAAYESLKDIERIKVLRALAISHLVTAYIKSYTGRLSAVCGCGVAAATGATAGLSYMMGLTHDQIDSSIDSMIAGISGMICDGAKSGCAVKLGMAASAAVQSAFMAKNSGIVPVKNGIVGNTVEESIKNLGRVSDEGMRVTDEIILSVMEKMNS